MVNEQPIVNYRIPIESCGNKPVLSICIPTRNRCEYLIELIKSIVSQHQYQTGEVEIIVSNNASTDNTHYALIDYIEKYNIKYIKHDVLIGSEINFRTTIREARGEYIKVINDSFLFDKNALNNIIEIIRKYTYKKPHLYFANNNHNKISEAGFLEFLYSSTYKLTAMATVGLWDEDKELIINDFSCDNNNLWCANTNIKLAKTKGKVVIIDKKLFSGQNLKKKYFDYSLFQVFHDNYLGLLKKYLVDINEMDKICNCIEKALFFNFFIYWIFEWKYQGSLNQKYVFLTDENLCERVYNSVSCKHYFAIWCIKYKLKEIVYVLKSVFKKLRKNCYAVQDKNALCRSL